MKQVIVHFDFPDATEEQYKAAWNELRAYGHSNPEGLIFHIGASKPAGGLMITDLWESEQAFIEFSKVLMPIITRLEFDKIKPTIMPVYYVYEGKTVGAL